MNKKIIGAIIALIIVICGYVYASPYLAINNIKKAAQAGDSETVSKYIDYASVRQSFKDQMNAKMAKELMTQDNDGFAALGAMLASTMVDKIVDGFVTPEGMTLILQARNPTEADQHPRDEQDTSTDDKPKVIYETKRTSMSDFEVVVKDHEAAQGVKVLMVRDGLSWKVNKIVVPME